MLFFGRKKKNKKEESILEKRPRLDLHPETKKTVWGIILFTLGLVIFLSFLGQAGDVGRHLAKYLETLFGWGKFLVPSIFITASIIFFRAEKRNVYFSTFLGGFLFLSTLLGFLEVVGGSKDFERHLGGFLGRIVSFPFLKFFGETTTLIILGAALIISILIFFNAPLKKKDEEEVQESEKAEKSKLNILPKIKEAFVKKEGGEKEELSKEEKGDNLENEKFTPSSRASSGGYKFPHINLLSPDSDRPTSGDIRANLNIIKRSLQNFDIEVEMGEVNIGPTVTQYTLRPAEGVKLARITTLQSDLALALAAKSLRMEAPIPGKSLVGIEVPNKSVALVRLRNIIDNPNFIDAPSSLIFPLGRDVTGAPVYADLRRMPHLLIAGSTGSGKTIALNCLIISLLYKNSPEMLRFILIDPKRVEFPVYNEIPHLLCPVITDAQKTILALRWLVGEMERRFETLAQAKARDIIAFNTQLQRKKAEDFMPYIVVIIDELADLMAARGKEVETGIVRLAQMARAVGIHLVVATQRPSVEVITGLIKANITSRIAFQVASQVDARTILDMAGAEKLLGSGDMLFLSSEFAKPRRIQGAYVVDKEVRRVVDWVKESAGVLDLEESKDIFTQVPASFMGLNDSKYSIDFEELEGESRTDDELYEEAKKLVIQARKASASYLQRRLRIGYARAARLMDMMEERGVVGPGEGAKPREVYITENEEPDIGQ